jgi:hypothetical protein
MTIRVKQFSCEIVGGDYRPACCMVLQHKILRLVAHPELKDVIGAGYFVAGHPPGSVDFPLYMTPMIAPENQKWHAELWMDARYARYSSREQMLEELQFSGLEPDAHLISSVRLDNGPVSSYMLKFAQQQQPHQKVVATDTASGSSATNSSATAFLPAHFTNILGASSSSSSDAVVTPSSHQAARRPLLRVLRKDIEQISKEAYERSVIARHDRRLYWTDLVGDFYVELRDAQEASALRVEIMLFVELIVCTRQR